MKQSEDTKVKTTFFCRPFDMKNECNDILSSKIRQDANGRFRRHKRSSTLLLSKPDTKRPLVEIVNHFSHEFWVCHLEPIPNRAKRSLCCGQKESERIRFFLFNAWRAILLLLLWSYRFDEIEQWRRCWASDCAGLWQRLTRLFAIMVPNDHGIAFGKDDIVLYCTRAERKQHLQKLNQDRLLQSLWWKLRKDRCHFISSRNIGTQAYAHAHVPKARWIYQANEYPDKEAKFKIPAAKGVDLNWV